MAGAASSPQATSISRRLAEAQALEAGVHVLVVAFVADLDQRVLVAAALAAVLGLPDEVEQHEVAGASLARLLDRVVARGLLAHPVDLLRHVLVFDLGPARGHAQPLPVGQLDERQRLEDGLEAHRLAFFELHLLDLGRRERLQAAAVELVEDDLVDDRLGGLAQDLVLEALLDDVERHLARRGSRAASPAAPAPSRARRSPPGPARCRPRRQAPSEPTSPRCNRLSRDSSRNREAAAARPCGQENNSITGGLGGAPHPPEQGKTETDRSPFLRTCQLWSMTRRQPVPPDVSVVVDDAAVAPVPPDVPAALDDRASELCATLALPAREWRNGRRARLRSVCPKGHGGSSPSFRRARESGPLHRGEP